MRILSYKGGNAQCEMLNIRAKAAYRHDDEFLVPHENQVKIECVIELIF